MVFDAVECIEMTVIVDPNWINKVGLYFPEAVVYRGSTK